MPQSQLLSNSIIEKTKKKSIKYEGQECWYMQESDRCEVSDINKFAWLKLFDALPLLRLID